MKPQPQELRVIETALISEPSVYDCAVRLQQTETGVKLIAFVVSGGGFEEARLFEWLRAKGCSTPDAIVPVTALPIDEDGFVNDSELAAVPVIDKKFLERCEEQLKSMPDISEAVVTTEETIFEQTAIHVSDLLPPVTGASAKVENIQRTAPQSTEMKSGPKIVHKPAISHGGPLSNPDIPLTMGDALRRAASMPATHGITYVQADGNEEYRSYSELLADAERILAGLRGMGVKPGTPIVFQLERNQDFIPVFWACMIGGFLAAPISIAPTYRELNATVSKLHNCWEVLGRPLIVAGEKLVEDVRSLASLLGTGELPVVGVNLLRDHERDQQWHSANPDNVCLILFTSGSTGLPKGVQQCHRSLLSRSAATYERNGFNQHDVSLNWFPLDHVGGIVMFHLMDLFSRAHQIQVPTEVILQDPLKWLDLIERHRATITWAPNFAFGLVNDHEQVIAARKWDLSSMRFILNGGEAIVPKTARRFLQLLASHGLRPDAMHPSWGMSETCSGVVFSERCQCDIVRDEDSFVEVGGPIAGVSLRIVDGKEQIIEEGQIGRLQISGSTVTSGYFRNPELNTESFSADGWFNTGDLAFLNEGRLTITGRAKDVIIVNGVNFYSHEIEAVVEEVNGVSVSFTAACAVRMDGSETDQLAVFFSTPSTDWAEILGTISRIRETVLRVSGVYAEYLIPLPETEIPKTAIGKIQRSKLRERLEAGEFTGLLKEIDVRGQNANTVPSWFFKRVWRRREANHRTADLNRGTYLIFADPLGMSDHLIRDLSSRGIDCIKVLPGSEFHHSEPGSFVIRPRVKEDYVRLIDELGADNHQISGVLHCWMYDDRNGEISSIEQLRDSQYRGVYSVLFLIQALTGATKREPLNLFVVSDNSLMTGDASCSEKGGIAGFLATTSLEIPWLRARHLDFDRRSVVADAKSVINELTAENINDEVAYRNGARHVPMLEQVDMLAEPVEKSPLKREGLYLVTGGLGGLGNVVAEQLLKSYDARLLVLGRTKIDESLDNDDSPIYAKRRNSLGALQQISTNIIYRACDLSDLALRKSLEEAEALWGQPIDGVFHMAGDFNLREHWNSIDEHWVIRETENAFERMFSAKVYGTWALLEMLKQRPDAIFVAFSSVNSLFGGSGFSAYSAANSFLDSMSLKESSRRKVYCFNWSMWDDVGMTEDSPEFGRETARSMGYQVIEREQGINSMLAGLCRNLPQLIVGLDAANPAIRRHIHSTCRVAMRPLAFVVPRNGVASISGAETLQTNAGLRLVPVKELPRDASGTIDVAQLLSGEKQALDVNDSVEPRTEMERQVARVWKEILGTSRINLHDTFFQLGGDSLTAMRLVNRLREALHVNISVRSLFEMPTVASLSSMLAQQSRTSAPFAAAAAASSRDLLGRIDHMDDAEVDALLEQMDQSA